MLFESTYQSDFANLQKVPESWLSEYSDTFFRFGNATCKYCTVLFQAMKVPNLFPSRCLHTLIRTTLDKKYWDTLHAFWENPEDPRTMALFKICETPLVSGLTGHEVCQNCSCPDAQIRIHTALDIKMLTHFACVLKVLTRIIMQIWKRAESRRSEDSGTFFRSAKFHL